MKRIIGAILTLAGTAVIGAALVLAVAVAIGRAVMPMASAAPRPAGVKLTLAAYSTPREAYRKIIPAFQAYWKQKTGQSVEFQESYEGSAAQARAVIGGFEADVVALSLEADVDKIAEAGLTSNAWKSNPYQGMVTDSVVVIATRPGNPKRIRDWEDLTHPGIRVLTPNPDTSGGARWNINAVYGAGLARIPHRGKGNPAYAYQLVRDIRRNVTILDKSARESMTNFESGVGDASITYENEALLARAAGKKLDWVTPSATIRIENPVAIVEKNVAKHGNGEVAAAFVNFLWSDTAQRLFAQSSYRPVVPKIAAEFARAYPRPAGLFTVAALGGWPKINQALYTRGAGVWARTAREVARR
jgi:sulfate/thiosulfate-binding protein